MAATLLVGALAAGGCARWGDTLVLGDPVALGDTTFATLHLDGGGRFWLGRAGEVRVVDAGGVVVGGAAVGGREAPRVVGSVEGLVLAREGDRVLALDSATGAARAERGEVGGAALAVDVRGRFLLEAAPSGAVLGHDPATLAPGWGWAAVRGTATAIALSPEGDRVYLALADEGGGARLQIRDLQTGRVLGAEPLPAPVMEMAAGSDGVVYALLGTGEEGAVLALEPRGSGAALRWRLTLDALDLGPPARIAHGAGRVAVWSRHDEAGLRVLDAETGFVVGSLGAAPLAAAFGPSGVLHLLYPGEVRPVRE